MLTTILQVVFCVLFLLVFAFFIGKKLGQRRYIKLQEDFKALDLSFNQTLEEIELVSAHNIKVIEAKTNEMKNIIGIVDQKCLYTHDLLANLDETSNQIKNTYIPASTAPYEPLTKSLRTEIKKVDTNLTDKINLLEKRLSLLEQFNAEQLKQELNATIDNETEQIKNCINNLYSELKTLEDAVIASQNMLKTLAESNFVSHMPASVSASKKNIKNIVEPATNVVESDIMAEASFCDVRALSRFSAPPIDEIIALSNEGATLPQIARKMNMGKGEIELVLKLHASKQKE